MIRGDISREQTARGGSDIHHRETEEANSNGIPLELLVKAADRTPFSADTRYQTAG